MSRSKRWLVLFAVFLCCIIVLVYYLGFVWESACETKFKKIQVGMSVDEVQAILGPGTPVKEEEVPGIVVAVNPQDVEASIARHRKSGGSPQTVRDYPTRIKGVVEGDLILKWVDSRTGERILLAFKDGKVCEKDYYDPNYL